MAGLAVVLRRDGGPAGDSCLRAMLSRLAHRGADGQRCVLAGPLAMGHCHFWTTPEEIGERQPLAEPADRYVIAADGRVDNRGELLDLLGIGRGEGAAISDAALLLRVYRRWGVPGSARVVGSFAAAIWDAGARRLVLIRDALGDRCLYYAATPEAFVAASEEHAVLAFPGVDDRLDERRVAQYFALAEPDSDATFFAAVKEVLPGHALTVEAGGVRSARYWSAGGREPLRLRDDREYGDAFRETLTAAVAAQVRSPLPVSVFLSGGLDSSSILGVAVRVTAPERLRAVSWVFDELPTCDERRWIDPVVRHCGVEALQFCGDREWPYRDFERWRRNPSSPEEDLYRRLVERGRAVAVAAGSRVVVSGMFGDHLYNGVQGWLWEAPGLSHPVALVEEAWRQLRREGAAGVRRALWPRRLPAPLRVLADRRSGRWPWLTERARELLRDRREWPDPAAGGIRPGQHRSVLGLRAARGVSGETFHAASGGVEVRHPFRDRRVVELALRLPGAQLDRPGLTRPVLREAMRGVLPDAARFRAGKGSLIALYRRGVVEREGEALRREIETGAAWWGDHVSPEWAVQRPPGARESEREEVVLGLCACYRRWLDIPRELCHP